MDRITRGESPSPRPIKKRTTKTSEQLVMGFALSSKVEGISLPPKWYFIGFVFEVCFSVTMNIMSPGFVLLVYLLGHDLIVEALFGCSYWNYKQCLYFKTQFLLVIFMHCFYCCVLSTLPVCFGSFYYLSFYSMKYNLLIKKRGKTNLKFDFCCNALYPQHFLVWIL